MEKYVYIHHSKEKTKNLLLSLTFLLTFYRSTAQNIVGLWPSIPKKGEDLPGLLNERQVQLNQQELLHPFLGLRDHLSTRIGHKAFPEEGHLLRTESWCSSLSLWRGSFAYRLSVASVFALVFPHVPDGTGVASPTVFSEKRTMPNPSGAWNWGFGVPESDH